MVKRYERVAWRALGALTVLLLALLTLPLFGAVGAQDAPTPTLAGTSTPLYSIVLEVYGDQLPQLKTFTPTPFPTWTPPPTDTPVPSATPSPTATATATPTSTPDVDDTPTPELTPPVPTPGPTVVPKACTLRADGFAIKIRSGPGTQYAALGTWNAGTERVFTQFAYDVRNEYVWGHHGAGWSVVYDVGLLDWWVDGTEAAALCLDVQGWPDALTPPPPIAAILDGFHLIVGAVQTLLNYVDRIGTMKGTSSASQIPLMAKQFNPDLVIVYRSLYNAHGQQDCPSPTEWYDAEAYFNALRPFGPMASTITSMRMSAAHRIA